MNHFYWTESNILPGQACVVQPHSFFFLIGEENTAQGRQGTQPGSDAWLLA